MFDTIPQTLMRLVDFAVFGFFAAFFYEIFRILRQFIRHNVLAAAIEDFIYLSLLGFFTFVFSLEVGGGYFRLYFIFGELFGAVVYFITIGKIINIIVGFIAKIVHKIFHVIYKYILLPIGKVFGKYLHKLLSLFGKLYKKLASTVKKSAKHLQSKRKMVYNKKYDNHGEDGEIRHVIKAEVRKKA